MRDGLNFELLLQLFFALECLSIWKVPRPKVEVNDFKTKESETLNSIVKPLGQQWEDFKPYHSRCRSAFKQLRKHHFWVKILHRILPNDLLCNEEEIPKEIIDKFKHLEDIYSRCLRFQRASQWYRMFQFLTSLICSFFPMVIFSIAVIVFSLFFDPNTEWRIQLLNILASSYFFIKLAVVVTTIILAKHYDKVLKEINPVENLKTPQGLSSVDC